MAPRSLKARLVIGVSIVVIASGALIGGLVTHQYGEALLAGAHAQGENLAHALALEAADKVLINDLIALRKMLDHQMRSTPSLGYLFVVRDGRILAHTFSDGVPEELVPANDSLSSEQGRTQRVVSKQGGNYLDIAWPIFGGSAGVLRLGLSEEPFREQVRRLGIQMGLVTLAVMLLSVGAALIYVKRITHPLAALAAATRRIRKGDMDTRVSIGGTEELETLGSAFNEMVERVKAYTKKLEEQANELARSHNQTRMFCEIVREIGALPTLQEMGPVLLERLERLLVCRDMALILAGETRNSLFVVSANGLKTISEAAEIEPVVRAVEAAEGVAFSQTPLLSPPIVPDAFLKSSRQAIIPIRSELQLFGAVLAACPGACRCDPDEGDLVGLVLSQSAGVLKRALIHEEEMRDLETRVENAPGFGDLIGRDPKMRVIYKLIEDIAPTDANVLIQGESGTGKELVARAIHARSERRDEPIVVINCSAYPDTLIESELFGHELGAFTGAIRRKAGRFEQAHRGTVFLDEVGEIPPQAQVKLLRVLQTQRFERLGGERTISVNVRVLAATNKDLLTEVQAGRFREDLFYRLNVIPVVLPPLRERRNDIALLAGHFLRVFAAERKKPIEEFGPEAMRAILDYSWPGNVRELENSIEHAVVLAKGTRAELSDLPAAVRSWVAAPQPAPAPAAGMRETEKNLLTQVLNACAWNKKEAARRLGIGRSTLYAKLRKHGLEKPTLQ